MAFLKQSLWCFTKSLVSCVLEAFCSSIWCWLCDTSQSLSSIIFHSVFSPHPPLSPLFFHIFFILTSVVSFFTVLFQILSSVLCFILLLHLPEHLLYCFSGDLLFFEKYFSFRHLSSWLAHAPGRCGFIDWGGVIK